ncbi:MAG: phosphoribosylaminoimidazolesuccinocarboxamide synthase [Phycisphaeraceae bacterium]|nr:MAG: phosphoribosylaminoimidazolesuccinocarboxamide synthase [Phycisphaeraceae bacterium]
MDPSSPPGADGVTSLFETDLRLSDRREGKVRDVYRFPGEPRIAIIATDRLSAFDVVMPTPIPGKGRLLTEVAAFWLRFIADKGICETHLLSTDAGEIPDAALTGTIVRRQDIEGRVTIGRLCRVLPVEFVVRGYLEGSGWRDYRETGSICGVAPPAGLRQCDKLPEPIFTPATKAEGGAHDENIDADAAFAIIDPLAGAGVGARLAETAKQIYVEASEYAASRGILIADTKFEFGLPLDKHGEPTGEGPILIDEALTPDSSRFWPADRYEPGHAQPSFDKQFVREYLQNLVDRGEWNKSAPGPHLPDEVVAGTLERYQQVRDRLVRGPA